MKIYFLCDECRKPIGGIKKIYNQVDILNKSGFNAFVLYRKKSFRCDWFDNDTKIEYWDNIKFDKQKDYLVLPEMYGKRINSIMDDVNKIIYNQNCYFTFYNYPIDKKNKYPYKNKNIKAVITISSHCYKYLKYVFPKSIIFRIHHGIDNSIFKYSNSKKLQITFYNKKNRLDNDIAQIFNILNVRKVLKNVNFVEIKNISEKQIAKIMKDSFLFLSLNFRDGFGLTPVEAMACGCVVVGYPGGGGEEYFKKGINYKINDGDILGFVNKIEYIINDYKKHPNKYLKMGKMASQFVKDTYSLEREERDIIKTWNKILN